MSDIEVQAWRAFGETNKGRTLFVDDAQKLLCHIDMYGYFGWHLDAVSGRPIYDFSWMYRPEMMRTFELVFDECPNVFIKFFRPVLAEDYAESAALLAASKVEVVQASPLIDFCS